MSNAASTPRPPPQPESCLRPRLRPRSRLFRGRPGGAALTPPKRAMPRAFEEWVAAGRAGTMDYLSARAKTASCSAPVWPFRSRGRARPWSALPAITAPAALHRHPPSRRGWIARYALTSRRSAESAAVPAIITRCCKKRLEALEAKLHAQLGDFESRGLRRHRSGGRASLATAAGLGWTGKEHLPHPSQARLVWISGCPADLTAESQSETAPAACCLTAAAPAAAASRPAPPTRSPRPTKWMPPAASPT